MAPRQEGFFPDPPVAVAGMVYLTAGLGRRAAGEVVRDHVLAIDAATGEEQWRRSLRAEETSDLLMVSVPAVSDGLLFVGVTVGQECAAASSDTPRSGPSVVIEGWRRTGAVVALDAQTGAVRWRVPTTGSGDSSPAVLGGVVYAGTEEGSVLALDAATGAERWRTSLSRLDPATGLGSVRQPAAVADGFVYAVSDQGLHALDAATGAERWHQEAMIAPEATPAVGNGMVYVQTTAPAEDGYPEAQTVAFDAASGEVRWRQGRGDRGSRLIGLDAGLVFLVLPEQGREQSALLVALDATSGTERWSAEAGHEFAGAVLANGVVYFTTLEFRLGEGQIVRWLGLDNTHFLYAVDATTGAELWRVETADEIMVPSTVADGRIFLIQEPDSDGSADVLLSAFDEGR